MHELLQFLNHSGFEYAPDFIGVDEKSNRECLSYIDGEVALRPWPSVLRTLSGLEQIARMLKQYHQIVVKFEPIGAKWHLADRDTTDSCIIRHGDIGPWNMVWMGDRLVGVIDWDFAEPGTILEDLAQVAWHCIPLKPPRRSTEAGVASEDIEERFDFFCRTYGVSKELVLQNISIIHDQEIDRMKTHGVKGVEPWATFLERGDLEVVIEDSLWLRQRYNLV
ncbi:aminoglycoside phosphotransferase family protein [Persicirhabdus sediminis]|uniref:Aminoglycoside phosphotransferase family protein n=1 Tax=Persicirhabdus sediminis TaxID=454144 RepID=A0A8J7MEL7_9BACT|nr:aminoglycoside phosphotransferase family protein [Persicirhabdus sediminis]MBK1791987.1 aminoglycoside phosphotransferase family protein [Persicirhabdus sediminis]